MATLYFPEHQRQQLQPYLPPQLSQNSESQSAHFKPFVTLTYAQSLDGQISLSPSIPTPLSGPSSKAMTHFLRSTHDAILVGSGTAIADDPSLNCRLEDFAPNDHENSSSSQLEIDDTNLKGQPRPVILDRRGRWNVSPNSKVIKLAKEGKGRAPWVFTSKPSHSISSENSHEAVTAVGGQVFTLDDHEPNSFDRILDLLGQQDIRSVMVEGGATLINEILTKHKASVDSFIVTIAPVLLGRGGVAVTPERQEVSRSAVTMRDVSYLLLDQDVVLCSKIS